MRVKSFTKFTSICYPICFTVFQYSTTPSKHRNSTLELQLPDKFSLSGAHTIWVLNKMIVKVRLIFLVKYKVIKIRNIAMHSEEDFFK